MSTLPPKTALKDELVKLLSVDLEAAERAQAITRAGATHEEAKPENDKDTRALEQSYLARGQAMRVEELRAAVVEVKAMPLRAYGDAQAIALGALVTAEEEEADDKPPARRCFFLAPQGGGAKLAEGAVLVVTPKSPLGQALVGKRLGDACEVRAAGRTRELSITAIA
jgi:transcription elongation GreA/GreB family factor